MLLGTAAHHEGPGKMSIVLRVKNPCFNTFIFKKAEHVLER